jgi:hypothetical protein
MARQKRMTEAAWQASTDTVRLLTFLRDRRQPSDRKLRLFACACARSLDFFRQPRHRSAAQRLLEALDTAEAFADGQGSTDDLAARRPHAVAHQSAFEAAHNSAMDISLRTKQPRLAGLLRCVFGNPFRKPSFDPAWRTPDAVGLARALYEERSLPDGALDDARLAVLADALEDAGCTDPRILAHGRGPGPHVRGCWVVDLVLARE